MIISNSPCGDSAAFLSSPNRVACRQAICRTACKSMAGSSAGGHTAHTAAAFAVEPARTCRAAPHACEPPGGVDGRDGRGLGWPRARLLRRTDASIRFALPRKGTDTLRQIGKVAQEHDRMLTEALSETERETLRSLLERIAHAQGLTPGVHPGYRTLGDPDTASREGK